MAVFEIKNLNFSYPECREKVINALSLTVEKGEFLVVCGPSGCGKSTLLRQLKTVLAPNGEISGEIFFDGQKLETLDNRIQSEKIGFVSQSPENQIVTDKVWHELAFGLESLGFDTPAIRGRVAEMASFFGIENWFYKNVTELSGGQKQLLNLASVMVMQPQVLILDEPTSQLDPIAASEFLETIAKINRELGTSIIMTEHRLEEAFAMASRVAVMENGSFICTGTPQEVGKYLKTNNSNIFLAMPTPMRVWASAASDKDCPVTISEGRVWLEGYSKTNKLNEVLPKDNHTYKGETAIDAKEIWFKYEKDRPDIVKELDFSVQKGEFLAILGGNGAGKTTTLKLISGQKKPYRGQLSVNGTTAVLPQNPQALFVKKTVQEDLFEIFNGEHIKKSEQEERAAYVVALCRLQKLLERHPYDLSGGEQQRAALAKVLLKRPEILLLDEPTKGLDAEFKCEFAVILNELLKQDVTIVMVSHDIEFCAAHAHRCALFFDGNIVTSGSPSQFFTGNSFYTTSANRMARDYLPTAVTAEDIIYACGGKLIDAPKISNEISALPQKSSESTSAEKAKKLPLWRKLIAVVSALFSLVIFFYAAAETDLTKLVSSEGITSLGAEQLGLYGLLIVSLIICAISSYRKSAPPVYIQTPKEKRKLKKRTVAASVLILLMVPLTLYINIFYFDSRQYYLTSLAVMIECMTPFFMVFEGKKPKARELVVIASLCAIAIAGRAVFFMLQQFKPVAAIVIIAGIAFGGETGFLVGAMTMLISNILFSQGPWTPFQMFAMGIIGFLAGVMFRKGFIRRSRVSMCIFGVLTVIVVYGGIMNPASALIWGGQSLNPEIIMTYYITGFPMDLVHAAATAIFLWFGGEPMLEKLDRIKVKYKLIE